MRGGYRPGSGPRKGTKYRPRAPKAPGLETEKKKRTKKAATTETLDPLTYMLRVMNDPNEPKDRRDKMAVSSAPYVHPRKGEGQGKKEDKADRAKIAGVGRFSPSKPPLTLLRPGKDNH